MGTVLLRGLVFKLLNSWKTTSKRDSSCSDNVSQQWLPGRCRESRSVLLALWSVLLRLVEVFTGWMVDRAFKELSASCTSSSSSLQSSLPAYKSGLLSLSSILSQEQ